MKNKCGNSGFKCFLVMATILLLRPCFVYPDSESEEDNEEYIQIPLRLAEKSGDAERGWEIFRFEEVPPNKIEADEDGLEIHVQSSAGLLTYCFKEETEVRRVLVEGSVTGLPSIPEGQVQGDEQADDFAIRFGLVISGKRKLSRTERYFASELVKRLSELVPKSQGVDHALFLNLANDPPPEWQERTHPLGNGMIRERIASTQNCAGKFTIDVKFEKPLKVLALCIVNDGDHTNSRYKVMLKNIQLNPKTKE